MEQKLVEEEEWGASKDRMEQGQRMGVGCIWARDGMRGDESKYGRWDRSRYATRDGGGHEMKCEMTSDGS